MRAIVLGVFVFVYAAMALGRLPGLALDRAGAALLGAIALVASGLLTVPEALGAADAPTLALLFGLMVVSAQLRLGGFYTAVSRRITTAAASPAGLLARVMLAAALLSAVLANDIVCLAMAPILVEGCTRRALNPRPYLLALACAANIGSAATLIGNPQNILIGQALQLSFVGYLGIATVPVVLGLAATWWIIARGYRGCWHLSLPTGAVQAPPFSSWQTGKGLLVLLLVTGAFLGTAWPRELVVLAAAALLLTSRSTASGRLLALVDWQLLLLFMGLFVINQALAATGLPTRLLADLAEGGLHVGRPHWLFLLTAGLSNLVSNVPAVMLLLPAAGHPLAGPILALSSTLAGNLLVVGSIANIIVVDQAARLGSPIGWRDHARIGIPVTLLSLVCCAAWLWLVMHFSSNG